MRTTSSTPLRRFIPWAFAVIIWIELWRSGGYWRYVVVASVVAVLLLLAIKEVSGRQRR